jgi:SAM-dependent methyltransferase
MLKTVKFLLGTVSILGNFNNLAMAHSQSPKYVYTNPGVCIICEKKVTFVAHSPWFRDHYRCPGCHSIPRERALLYVLSKTYPNYKNLIIHESSPSFRATSLKLKKTAPHYSYSYYVEGKKSGEYLEQYNCSCQDLGDTSFNDNSFDIVITQDVMEHIFDIENVFREIARILKVGGSHIFTTPLVNKHKPTVQRASLTNGKIVHILPPHYHGNPIDKNGSLVTYDLGYDTAKFTPENCFFTIYVVENKELGLEKTEYNEVCVMTKFKS